MKRKYFALFYTSSNGLEPHLRFKCFKDKWLVANLEKIFKISAGGDIERKNFSKEWSQEFSYPVYANALTNSGLYGFANYYKVEGNSITVTGRGDVGHAIARYNKYVPIVRLLTLIPKSKTNVLFFENAINSTKIFVESTGVPQLTSPQLGVVKIHYPHIEEQNKIADFLSLVDKRIEKQRQLVENLKKYKRGYLKNIISEINTTKYLIKNIVSEHVEKTTKNEQYPILSSTLSGIKLQENYFNKQAASENTIGYKIVPKGYFTYRSMSDTGIFRFNCQNLIEKGIVSPAYPVFILNNAHNSVYFEYILNETDYVKQQLLTVKEGGTRYALSFSKFQSLSIELPELCIQNKIAHQINFLNLAIEKEELILTKILLLKQGLLQQMFI